LRNHFSAFKVKPKANLPQTRLQHGAPQSFLVNGMKHEETAATGTNEFATGGTAAPAELVPNIDT
jgi:hypothetical protein